jgi:hypothetical protein
MSGMEDIYVGLISFLPAILIFVAVAAIAAKRLKQRDDTSGKKPAQAGGVQSYTPKGYPAKSKRSIKPTRRKITGAGWSSFAPFFKMA